MRTTIGKRPVNEGGRKIQIRCCRFESHDLLNAAGPDAHFNSSTHEGDIRVTAQRGYVLRVNARDSLRKAISLAMRHAGPLCFHFVSSPTMTTASLSPLLTPSRPGTSAPFEESDDTLVDAT